MGRSNVNKCAIKNGQHVTSQLGSTNSGIVTLVIAYSEYCTGLVLERYHIADEPFLSSLIMHIEHYNSIGNLLFQSGDFSYTHGDLMIIRVNMSGFL